MKYVFLFLGLLMCSGAQLLAQKAKIKAGISSGFERNIFNSPISLIDSVGNFLNSSELIQSGAFTEGYWEFEFFPQIQSKKHWLYFQT